MWSNDKKKLDGIGARVFEKMKVMVLRIKSTKKLSTFDYNFGVSKFANHTWEDVCMKVMNEEKLMRNEKGGTSEATSFTNN